MTRGRGKQGIECCRVWCSKRVSRVSRVSPVRTITKFSRQGVVAMSMEAEDEASPLHHGSSSSVSPRARRIGVIVVTLTLVVLALSAVIVVGVMTSSANIQPGRVTVLMLGDGFGPASVSLLRAFLNHTSVRNRLFLDDYLIGSVQTASLDSRITDSGEEGQLLYFGINFRLSAAGASAYACGQRTFNNWVATASDGRACGTLMEGSLSLCFDLSSNSLLKLRSAMACASALCPRRLLLMRALRHSQPTLRTDIKNRQRERKTICLSCWTRVRSLSRVSKLRWESTWFSEEGENQKRKICSFQSFLVHQNECVLFSLWRKRVCSSTCAQSRLQRDWDERAAALFRENASNRPVCRKEYALPNRSARYEREEKKEGDW